MKVLVVIEAPGKIKTLSAVLASLEIEAEVIATHGHLYDSPDALIPVCIDDRYTETMRGPIDQSLIDKIILSASKCDYVLAAADPDQEGDVIAQDVANILHSKNVLRVKFHGLDEESVKKGLDSIKNINVIDSWPGTARRVLDRLIGAVMTGKFGIPSGRVQSALLGFIAKNPQPYAKLTMSIPAADGGMPFTAEVPVTWVNKEGAEALLERSKTLPPCEVESRKSVISTKPWNYGEILCHVQERIGGAPRDVMLSLQALYESGSMSYPRASARAVGENALECLEKLADKYDLNKLFVRGRITKTTSENAHESPRPFTSGLNLNMPVKLMDFNNATASLITRNLLMSGIEVTEERPSKMGLPKWTENIDFKRVLTPPIPWKSPVIESGIVKIHPDVIAIQAMINAGIGRPSTHCEHAEKFNARGLVGADYKLTKKGEEWIDALPVELSTHENSSRIEKFIENSGMSPEEMVSKITASLGETIQQEIKSALSTSANFS